MSSITNVKKLEHFVNFTLHDPFEHHHFVKEVKIYTKTIQDLGNPFAHKARTVCIVYKNTLSEKMSENDLRNRKRNSFMTMLKRGLGRKQSVVHK